MPGTFQAEDYDSGGEGVACLDTDPGNNGGAYRSDHVAVEFGAGAVNQHNVGWIDRGEWLSYTFTTATGLTGRLRYRVASAQYGPVTLPVRGR